MLQQHGETGSENNMFTDTTGQTCGHTFSFNDITLCSTLLIRIEDIKTKISEILKQRWGVTYRLLQAADKQVQKIDGWAGGWMNRELRNKQKIVKELFLFYIVDFSK